MNNKIILNILLAILIIVTAVHGYIYYMDEIKAKANELARDEDWMGIIIQDELWVHNNIEGELSYYPIGLEQTWKHKKGDCTDMSELTAQLLRYQGYKAKTVHGYIDCYGESIKHDWVIVNVPILVDSAIIEGREYCTYEYKGDGVW